MEFIILHHGDGTLHVHRNGRRDTRKRLAYPAEELQHPWLAHGETVQQALQPELDELNEGCDNTYGLDAWFTIFPCCK